MARSTGEPKRRGRPARGGKRRGAEGRGRAKARARTVTLTVDRLGLGGDGFSSDIAVPFALPGETVTATVTGRQARVTQRHQDAPSRASAPCPHFGLPGDGCGGCRLQHVHEADYRALKLARLTGALTRAGLDLPPIDTVWCPPGTRRRGKLAFVGGEPALRALASDRLVPIRACRLFDPALLRGAAMVGGLLDHVPTGEREVLLTLTETGLDVDVPGADEAAVSLEGREAVARLATAADLARLSLAGIPLIERRTPRLHFGGVPVALPPGGFLQASPEGEAALIRVVERATEGARRIADLFCGVGTFALPLSSRSGADVLAVEADPAATGALARAAGAARRPLRVETRDLFTRPLLAADLAGLDAVVLDPPRAGAAAQAEALVGSAVPLVAYVSCDPGTLSRDAARLAAAYDLISLALVDQFVWSPHIEAVAVFERRPA